MKNIYFSTISHCFKFFTILLVCFPIATKAQEAMRVNLYVVDANGPALVDGNLTNYNSIYSNAVDINDAWKITNPGINFGILRDGYDLVVERRSIIVKADTTFFKMWNVPQNKYRMKFMLSNLNHPGLNAVLKDTYLNNETAIALNDTTNYDFVVNADAASAGQKRFILLFRKTTNTQVDVKFTRIDAQRKDKDVMLEWGVTDEVSVESYVVEHSTDGINFNDLRQQAADNSGSSKTYNYQYTETSTADNYYRIKAINISGNIEYSQVAKITAPISSDGVSVYPNPVINKTVHLQFNNLPEGKYSFTLLYNNGISEQLSSAQIDSRQSNYSVYLPKSLPTGIYHLKITGPDGRNIIKTIQVMSE